MDDSLNARCVAVSDEDWGVIVGFADDKVDTNHYLMLQGSIEYDEQDIALEMDRIHIERDDQAQSAYSGVESFVLHRDRATLQLDEATALKLKVTRPFEIHFAIGDDEFNGLRRGLRRLFEGTSYLAEPAF